MRVSPSEIFERIREIRRAILGSSAKVAKKRLKVT